MMVGNQINIMEQDRINVTRSLVTDLIEADVHLACLANLIIAVQSQSVVNSDMVHMYAD